MVISGMAAVAGFGCGVVAEHWRQVGALKANPCFYKKWDPTERKVVSGPAGEFSCYPLSDVAQFEGVWVQGFEQSTFSDGSWLDFESGQRERIYRMLGAGIGQEPERIHLKFHGRKAIGPGPYGHMGGYKSLIVVTSVEEASAP